MALMSAASVYRWLYRLAPAVARRELMRIVPVPAATFEVKLPGGEKILLGEVEQSQLLRNLFWRGFEGYEYETTSLFYMLAKNARVVIDIGAYVFYYGLIAAGANPRAKVFCFEPIKDNFDLGCRFVKENRFENLVGIQAAVGDMSGPTSFFLPDRSHSRLPNIGSLKNRFKPGETFSDRSYREVPITATTLDEFAEQQQLGAVDLVKIDTEETEAMVLHGAFHTISRFKPDIILELIPEKESAETIAMILGGHGYSLYAIRKNELVRIESSRKFKELIGPTGRQYGEILCSCRADIKSILTL